MKPGRYSGISNEAYHAAEGISKSGLDHIAQSPLHYQAYKLNRAEPTKAMEIGTAVHTLVLEPEKFDGLIVVGKRVKAEMDAARASGKIVLTEEDRQMVCDMADSIHCHKMASALLGGKGIAEDSFWWDHELGVLCKCRPDYLREDMYIVDVKTTEDASLDGFARSAEKYRYHVQAAFYTQGVEAITGERVKGFAFIAVEKTAPYAVACYLMDGDAIQAGHLEVERCLSIYRRCEEVGEWPGYSDELIPLSRPRWAA